MQYLTSIIIGYLLGSVPTAYLLLKITKGIDIRKSGSGNVGAFNSITTSKSKFIGLVVLLIDFSKGLLTVYLINFFYQDIFLLPAIGICAAVFSHNYNPWLKFKGGRGLATAAGGSAVLFPFLLLVWCVLWVISFLYKNNRNVIIANVSATVLSFLIVISTINIAVKYTYPSAISNLELILFTTILLSLLLAKHIVPFKDEIKRLNLPVRGNKNAN
ncbi:MAG TPA: glycerol-3-phosphate acyltransferase [Ignavibacteria bacterium]|nr:glycerol-3-phosphate acyltransferase [Ignavibacteria bacterium]